jgi:hypothetical protein
MDTFTLFKAWLDLFATRPDIDIVMAPELEDPATPAPGTAADLAAFGRQAGGVRFAYKLRPRPEPNIGDPDGYVFVSATGEKEAIHLDLGARGTFAEGVAVDYDYYGNGWAAYAVPEARPPVVVWDIEDCVYFDSFDAYLRAGARRGFCYRPDAWQRGSKAPHPLAAASLDPSTPTADLRAALVARGAEPAIADGLLAWLGADVVLLLPRAAAAKAPAAKAKAKAKPAAAKAKPTEAKAKAKPVAAKAKPAAAKAKPTKAKPAAAKAKPTKAKPAAAKAKPTKAAKAKPAATKAKPTNAKAKPTKAKPGTSSKRR